jgi:hypothetical protein
LDGGRTHQLFRIRPALWLARRFGVMKQTYSGVATDPRVPV